VNVGDERDPQAPGKLPRPLNPGLFGAETAKPPHNAQLNG
jgi:hypothetical protein